MKKLKTLAIDIASGLSAVIIFVAAMLYLPTRFENTNNICQSYVLELYHEDYHTTEISSGNFLALMHYANDYKNEYGVVACSMHYWADKL